MAWWGWWKSRSLCARQVEAMEEVKPGVGLSWLSSSASTSVTVTPGTAPPCRGCRSSARPPFKVSEGVVAQAGFAWCPSSMSP